MVVAIRRHPSRADMEDMSRIKWESLVTLRDPLATFSWSLTNAEWWNLGEQPPAEQHEATQGRR